MILLSALVAGAQTAAADVPSWYSSVNLGFSILDGSPTHADRTSNSGADYDLDNSGVAGLGASYSFGTGLRLEVMTPLAVPGAHAKKNRCAYAHRSSLLPQHPMQGGASKA